MNRRNWQICEYFGKQFCPACMHDVRHYLPEKIISNWDFGHKYQLSRRAVSVLDKNLNQPFIDLDMVNPELEKTVSEIRLVKELRQRLRILKRLIGSCKNASNEQLTSVLDSLSGSHVYNQSHLYSLFDLFQVKSGKHQIIIDSIIKIFTKHVLSCSSCSSAGMQCSMCKQETLIFPFEEDVITCIYCSTLCHKQCSLKYQRIKCCCCGGNGRQLQQQPES
ncbi:hypothetical protein ACOME3_008185 [Neoechinorhynchus agilis]